MRNGLRLLVLTLLLCSCALAAPAAAPAQAGNPLAGQSWFVERGEHPAWRSYRAYARSGRPGLARLMWKVAREPKFRWFGRWSRPHHLRDYLAAAGGQTALVTIMRHQGRSCGGGYDGGGLAEDARTRRWYRRYARIIGSRSVVVAFEPDSLGTVHCLTPSRRAARLRLLRYGVKVFSRLPAATVYLEAGASDWQPARRTARQLRAIGIHRVRGFMLNVTHYDWTRANVRHGRRISRRVGGKPFVINTAMNGRGPLHLGGANVWCNPPGRGLGRPPTASTGIAGVDAFLWISRPGFSAGACNGGPLPVGSWWPERALTLARLQTPRLGPARAAAAAQAGDRRGVDPLSPNPLLGEAWYVNKGLHPAWLQYRRYRRQGKRHRAALMWEVAGRPKFHWFGRFSRMEWVRSHIDDAERAGQVPLIAVMRHQGRRCAPDYDGGGPAEDARTREWYRSFADTIGSARVILAFEPDSLGTIDCIGRPWRQARLDLLRYGVDVLSQLPNATIYLEAGASDWEPAARTAAQLAYIGVHKVRGFMLNVTHYDWTQANIRHGLAISARIGGKPFIVNTATNGRGPVHWKNARGRVQNVWCHPLKRGLGPPPTTLTHHPKVDAYMWINRPGYSGGRCNGGPLPVGAWWPERALMLAKYSTRWIRPPRGTRFGLYRRHSLREVAGDGYR